MLSTTPLRYELLLSNHNKYAILDHEVCAWASIQHSGNTWAPLADILATSNYVYTFEHDHAGSTTKPYSLQAYLSIVANSSHITSLGYFNSISTFAHDYPEYLI